jgi:hypothetical protein
MEARSALGVKVSDPLYVVDRSGAETDDTCHMKFWWNRREGGTGVSAVSKSIYLTTGTEVHDDLEALANMEDLSPASLQAHIDQHILAGLTNDDRVDQSLMEHVYRRAGWFAAWGLYIEPAIRAEFDNVSTESEIVFDRRPLLVPVTPDRVLRHKQHGYLIYREWKSTISASKRWLDSWGFAIQLHLGLKAIEEELKEPVKYAQIVGLMKGDTRGDHLAHPYVYGWYNDTTEKWTTSYENARSQAWSRMPVWEFAGGVVEWVQMCGPDVAVSQFPHTPPIMLNSYMLDQWVIERTRREESIAQVTSRDSLLFPFVFPHNLKACRPPFGDPCEYLLACWNATVNDNPLRCVDYEPRVPHHPIELLLRQQGDTK